MIGNDPRYQAIIDAYRTGELESTTPPYNPIYDIRREQIESGELEEGARFPRPQLETTPAPVEGGEEGTFDPCPPGYQLIDGVCQPDTMFNQGGGRDREPFTGPKISPEGLIEGYEQVLSPGMGAMNSMQMMELERRFGPEMAQQMGLLNQKYRSRGVQYNPTTGKFVAMSPTLGQLGGDIAGGFGNMFGAFGDAAQQYLASGGMLGALANLFTPKQPTVTYGGGSDMTITETGPTVDLRKPIIEELVSAPVSETGSSGAPTGIVRPGYSAPSKTPKKGTGASGPPGRNYSSARSRAEKAAKKLGTKLATRGR